MKYKITLIALKTSGFILIAFILVGFGMMIQIELDIDYVSNKDTVIQNLINYHLRECKRCSNIPQEIDSLKTLIKSHDTSRARRD
jgi:hypothetical protein